MRKITKESIKAFLNAESFSKSNMIVKIEATENGLPCLVRLYLHGNMIAERHVNKRTERLYITNCGWFTNTTKERLNALPNVSIKQKNFVWYLNGREWNGELTEIKL
jgi:hypothetical protein